MATTAGWKIWGKSGEQIREFMVAKASEQEAFAVLKSAHPDVTILSRHAVDHVLINGLGIAEGKGVEWIPIDPKEKLSQIGGVPIES